MKNITEQIFENKLIVEKIQKKLPKLFQLAGLESSRAGKVGMEVGSIRERIIVALLIYIFGEDNIISNIPITKSEIDVIVKDNPISIKTITSSNFSGIKLIWTVDSISANLFRNNYLPNYDMIIVQINWNKIGGFYYIPKEVQLDVFYKIGKDNYLKMPKEGTNPWGVELATNALKEILQDNKTCKIEIVWRKERINFNAYDKWIELWKQK